MKIALTAATVLAALAMFLWLGPNGGISEAGVIREQTSDQQLAPVGSTSLTEVRDGASGRMANLPPALGSTSPSDEESDADAARAPLSLQVMSKVTGQPAPFVELRLVDPRGASMTGLSDKNGWLRGPATLAVGPVSVVAVIRSDQEIDDFVFGHGPNPQANILLRMPKEAEAKGRDVSCILDVPRRVPVRVSAPGADGLKFGLGSSSIHFYGAVDSSTTSDDLKWKIAGPRPTAFADHLLGATHVLSLQAEYGPTEAEAAWAPDHAKNPDAKRELEVYALVDGVLLSGHTPAAIVPHLGDPPLQVTLRPVRRDEITLPAARVRFRLAPPRGPDTTTPAAKPALQEVKGTRVVKVTVRSATGQFGGRVSVRASPTSAAKAAHAKTSEVPLRMQWIDAAFTSVGNGAPRVRVALDGLDEAEYDIRVICLDGGPSAVDSVRLTAPRTGSRSIEMLLPDR